MLQGHSSTTSQQFRDDASYHDSAESRYDHAWQIIRTILKWQGHLLTFKFSDNSASTPMCLTSKTMDVNHISQRMSNQNQNTKFSPLISVLN